MQHQVRGITSSFLQVVAADVLGLEDSPEDWAQLRHVARLVRPHARRWVVTGGGSTPEDWSQLRRLKRQRGRTLNQHRHHRGQRCGWAELEHSAAVLASEPNARAVFLHFVGVAMAAKGG